MDETRLERIIESLRCGHPAAADGAFLEEISADEAAQYLKERFPRLHVERRTPRSTREVLVSRDDDTDLIALESENGRVTGLSWTRWLVSCPVKKDGLPAISTSTGPGAGLRLSVDGWVAEVSFEETTVVSLEDFLKARGWRRHTD